MVLWKWTTILWKLVFYCTSWGASTGRSHGMACTLGIVIMDKNGFFILREGRWGGKEGHSLLPRHKMVHWPPKVNNVWISWLQVLSKLIVQTHTICAKGCIQTRTTRMKLWLVLCNGVCLQRSFSLLPGMPTCQRKSPAHEKKTNILEQKSSIT